ncbi:MAG: transposase [Thermocladium sp.]|jgi:IS605 OrfB family transposase|nr:MAG: hypothetical protein AT710_09335 [Thermocladium sp. ECH_B]
MDRVVRLRVKADYNTYSALKEVEEEYKAILENAVNYGFESGAKSFIRVKAGIYGAEREKHKDLPSHYIYTACEDASERLKSFQKLRRMGRNYTDKPEIRRITVHLDDHLWRFSLSWVEISTKRGRVRLSPMFPKIFWRHYNDGWRMASEARFGLLKGNVVELYIIFKRDEPKPYEPEGLIPVDLNEDSVSVLIGNTPVLLETNTKRITLGYEYRREGIMRGKSTRDRDVRRKLRRLREGNKKLDVRRKLAKLIVKEALETGSAVVLENLPKRAPEHMVRNIRDPQLRLRIYRAAFASMKRTIIEKAGEYGVPVILVNPAFTSSKCPIHGAMINYRPDGGNAPRVGRCPVGGELWHRDVVSLYNLRKRAGGGSLVPLGSTGTHDPPIIGLGRWLRSKSLRSIVNEYKMSEMRA